MKSKIFLLVSLLGLLFFTSCQNDEDKIIGKWSIIEFQANDENAIEQNNVPNYIEFEKDGFLKTSINGKIHRGKWSINKSEKEITLHIFQLFQQNEDLVGKYEIVHDSMKIKGSIADTYVFILLGNK